MRSVLRTVAIEGQGFQEDAQSSGLFPGPLLLRYNDVEPRDFPLYGHSLLPDVSGF